MNIKLICDTVFRLYLYALSTKKIHYSTNKNHTHELADEIRNEILEFVDELAETSFGIFGKPKLTDMTLKLDIHDEDNLESICSRVIETIDLMYSKSSKNDKLSGIVSLIDDFKAKMYKMKFLSSFDKINNYK